LYRANTTRKEQREKALKIDLKTTLQKFENQKTYTWLIKPRLST